VTNPHTSSSRNDWYAIRTHPKQEVRADQNLRVGGIESFLPMIRAPRSRRYYQYSSATPLFPQYLFARFDPARRLHDVSFTRGVQSVVHVGPRPAAIDDGVIRLWQARMDDHGLIRIGEPLRPGERVIVADSPFITLAGVVERVLPERERVIVLLTAVQSAFRVDVALEAVRRVSAPL
jgi:transcriptional antiterminator RfaH